MKTIELTGHVDADHRLVVDVPPDVTPGKVKVLLEVESSGDEVDGDEFAWQRLVASAWADELSDPREDIYTLADGEPVDGSR